ncbi:hypothetical protein GDO86_006554 [Hymenochirus boettgeri]|uniref:Uncharacterized protein n=1 Tax=Hymenochirus boettgeri TaxID=247094 RepID=A0A8T2J6P3_9PIPI|nr:hypothetical protein GDO86_006554 [Hymenochirus boettgeri]
MWSYLHFQLIYIFVCLIRGIIHAGTFTYGIEPSRTPHNFEHIIYNMKQFDANIVCSLDTSSQPHFTERSSKEEKLPGRNKTAYVELFMVVTEEQFLFHHENKTLLMESMLDLINAVNAVFQPLNTQIILNGIEIWSNGNIIYMEGMNDDDILMDFLLWKRENLDEHMKTSVAVLSLRDNTMPTSGLSQIRGACSLFDSAIIIKMNLEKMMLSLDLFVHELGHILGMKHDTTGCTCKSEACVMTDGGLLSLSFSNCSKSDMEDFFSSSESTCLWKQLSQCGNKVLEPGEECDCGTAMECRADTCCDPVTCKLREGVECLFGLCCKDCKFLPKGTPCRMPKTECDLTEYCSGTSGFCPPDMYQQNGSPCNNGSTVAPLSCFQSVNTKGDRFGNCNMDRDMIKCEIKDVMCGRLQCQNVNAEINLDHNTSIIITSDGNSRCWGMDFHPEKDSLDLGAVPDGAPCEEGKICLNKMCLHSAILSYDCDGKSKCAGNGFPVWRDYPTVLLCMLPVLSPTIFISKFRHFTAPSFIRFTFFYCVKCFPHWTCITVNLELEVR